MECGYLTLSASSFEDPNNCECVISVRNKNQLNQICFFSLSFLEDREEQQFFQIECINEFMGHRKSKWVIRLNQKLNADNPPPSQTNQDQGDSTGKPPVFSNWREVGDYAIRAQFKQSHPNQKLWEMPEIESMSTAQIFNQLKTWGIPLTEEIFLRDFKELWSGGKIADRWKAKYLGTKKADDDFLWMAVIVLGRRLAPGWMTTEMIHWHLEDMHEYFIDARTVEGFKLWKEIWSQIKRVTKPQYSTITSIPSIASDFRHHVLEEGLLEALGEFQFQTHAQRQLAQDMATFCSEFLALFPKTPDRLKNTIKESLEIAKNAENAGR